MRRKRFQRGSLKAQKRRGKLRWYAQWREEGIPKSKELGLCSELIRIAAEAMLNQFLQPINEGTEIRERTDHSFEAFIELVYLPIYEQKWKESKRRKWRLTGYSFIWSGSSASYSMRKINREELQRLLDTTARRCAKAYSITCYFG